MEVYTLKNDELMHYGVLGMKWGVRRYQNKDGSMTDAGKKRFVKTMTRKNVSVIDSTYDTINSIKSIKEVQSYKQNDSYNSARKKMDNYRKTRDEYIKKYDKARRDIIPSIEKKYGKYEDLERKSDVASMKKFNDAYDKEMGKRGIYSEKKKLEKYRKDAFDARDRVEKETRTFVSSFLGKHGDKKLTGQGSAIYKGRKVVDRLTANDIMTTAVMDELNDTSYSRDRR